MRAAWALVAVSAVAGCAGTGGATSSQNSSRTQTKITNGRSAGISFVRMPNNIYMRCRESDRLRPVCPRRIPVVAFDGATSAHFCIKGRGTCLFGNLFDTFALQRGGENPRLPTAQAPPGFLHIEIWAGHIPSGRSYQEGGTSPFLFRWPESGTTPVRDGLMSRRRSTALSFGQIKVGSLRGQLVLAPPTQSGGGLVGNHLLFRTREAGADYLVSLHAWEPLSESVTTLRKMIETTDLGRR